MNAPETTMTGDDHNLAGEFIEIEPPDRVSFTWAWSSAPEVQSVVTYALSDAGAGRTTLTLTHEKLPSGATGTGTAGTPRSTGSWPIWLVRRATCHRSYPARNG